MEGLGSLLVFAVLFFLVMRYGCGAHMMHGHGGHSHVKKNDKNHIDPVCDMAVDPEQGYGKMYKGLSYHFCSKSCLEKFDLEPEHYLNKERGVNREM